MVPARKGFRMIPVGNTKGYELIHSRVLDARKVGRLTMITTASIKNYVDSLPRFEGNNEGAGGGDAAYDLFDGVDIPRNSADPPSATG
jgi:hypothetical protein